MPITPSCQSSCHRDVAAARASRLGPRLDERGRLPQDSLLDSLPLAVQVLELRGQPVGLDAVVP